MSKDVTINFRCSEEYKISLENAASDLDMSLSQYIRFCIICKLNLEKNSPELFYHLVDMTNYFDV